MNIDTIKPYAKAIAAGASAGLTAAITALADEAITTSEWLGIALAVLVGTGLVYAVPNQKAPDGL